MADPNIAAARERVTKVTDLFRAGHKLADAVGHVYRLVDAALVSAEGAFVADLMAINAGLPVMGSID